MNLLFIRVGGGYCMSSGLSTYTKYFALTLHVRLHSNILKTRAVDMYTSRLN